MVFFFSSNPHSFACSPSYLLWSISNEKEEEEREERERNRFHLTPRTSYGKTEEVGGRKKTPCPFLEQEKDRAFPSFFSALVVIIRFDLGHPSDVQLWIGLTLVTHTHFSSFLLQLLTPACQVRCGSRVCPLRKNHNLYFTIQTGTGNTSIEKNSVRLKGNSGYCKVPDDFNRSSSKPVAKAHSGLLKFTKKSSQ